MKANEIAIPAGTHIEAAAGLLIGNANATGRRVIGMFNGQLLRAEPGGATADVVAAYEREASAAAERWRRSPKGRATAKADALEVASLQARADDAARYVGYLDLSDQAAVLAFLCDLQPCSDRIGVKIDSHEILVAFAFGGLVPGMCVGEQFKADDRDVFFRWLVGQALDGLANGPAIHGIFHKFADEWRAKWGAAPQTTGAPA